MLHTRKLPRLLLASYSHSAITGSLRFSRLCKSFDYCRVDGITSSMDINKATGYCASWYLLNGTDALSFTPRSDFDSRRSLRSPSICTLWRFPQPGLRDAMPLKISIKIPYCASELYTFAYFGWLRRPFSQYNFTACHECQSSIRHLFPPKPHNRDTARPQIPILSHALSTLSFEMQHYFILR
jgi:hypothetical protein